jgi:hypothetical protein
MTQFSFRESGSDAALYYGDDPILSFTKESVFFGGRYRIHSQKAVPGGECEINAPTLFGLYSHGVAKDMTYAVEQGDDSITLRITPVASQELLQQVSEETIIEVRLENGLFVWKKSLITRFLDEFTPSHESPFNLCFFPEPSGEEGIYLEFDDPQPAGASGPAVPMSRDWRDVPEPSVGQDSFTAVWRRCYTEVIFQNEDGSYHWSDLNKAKWAHLIQDNRRARPCHPQGELYLVKDDGSALCYRVDAPTHYHHICEWGMDFHFWLDLKPFMRGGVIPAGTEIVASTEMRLVDAAHVAAIKEGAHLIELTARERARADQPLYEEPENSFQRSALDYLDSAQVWQPSSEGCAWERESGYEGSGALVVRNSNAKYGEWFQDALGPSQWGNPFVPGGRYRFSAWVKEEDIEWDSNDPGAQIGVEFTQFNGPAVASTATLVEGGWSPGWGAHLPWITEMEWQKISIVVQAPSNSLRAKLRLRFIGRGAVYFSRVRWEEVE